MDSPQVSKEMTSIRRETSTTSTAIFRFFDLPGEIRHEVYTRYFDPWDVIVQYESPSESFKLKRPVSYPLLLANRSIYSECARMVSQLFSGRMIIRDVKICRQRGMGFVSSLDIIGSLVPRWLLGHTKFLSIEQGTTGMLMMLPWFKLKSLQEIDLEAPIWPIASCHDCHVSTELKESRENNALEGKYDTWCIHGFNTWSQVPEPVAQGHVRVVTVRKGLVKDVFLTVKVEHRQESAEALDRTLIPHAATSNKQDGRQCIDEKQTSMSCHPM